MFSKKKKDKDFDAQFEAFLKESVSSEESSLDTARVAKYLQRSKKAESQPSWWMNGDDDSISETALGLTGTGKSFLKRSEPAVDVPRRENNFKQPRHTDGVEVNMSRDSLDETSLRGRYSYEPKNTGNPLVPGLALDSSNSLTETVTADKTHPGLETLQEIAEKEKFFEDLQKNSGDSTIDYSRLNRDLDRSATLQGTLSSEMVRDEGDRGQEVGPEEDDDDYDYVSDEGEEEDHYSVGRSPSPDEENRARNQKAKDGAKSSMLSKVALMDSLDSTMGTKYASQETRPDDMKTIPEGHEVDDLDGVYVAPVADSHAMTASEPTTKGLKTGTGFGFTDTSHEIEALQAAYRQVGMSATMGSTHDFTLQGSSSVFNGTSAVPVGESAATTGTAEAGGTDKLSGFGLRPMLHNVGASQRTVEDIIHEVDELRKTGEQEIMPAVRFKDEEEEEEVHGFDLSPAHTQSDMHGMDLSPVHTASQPDHNQDDNRPFELYESSSSPVPIPAPRTPRKPERRHQKEKYPHVRSSGYGKLSTPPKKNPKDSRSPKNVRNGPNSSWTPADTIRNKMKGTEQLRKSGGKIVSSENADSQLVASVQSFANYIQSHFTESQDFSEAKDGLPLHPDKKITVLEREKSLMKEVKEWQDQWREERKMVTKLKVEMDNVEREQNRKLESQRIAHEEEMFKLKQENFVLSAKVSESDSDSAARRKSVLEGAGKDGMSKEQLVLLEKEIREQEGLLAGYQAENERLYQELKKMQNLSKTTEQQMFKENQRLNQEVSNLRQQLEQKEIALKNRGLITGPEVQQQIAAGNISSAVLGAGRIAQLEAELRAAKGREDIHKKEMMSLSRAKHEVEKQVDDTFKKITEFEEQIKFTQASKSDEVKAVEARYEAEIDKLNRKIKWFVENQELLDRDHELLKKKDETIRSLQDKTEHLTTEHGRRQAEAKARLKERATDANKIKDLQRQVREMESIIRKRHPNSLPVLMWAANAALENEKNDVTKAQPSVRFLEDRCRRLESELESKDEEEKRGLRVMEQKYNAVKYQYEDRIKTLEMKLAKFENSGEDNHPHSHTVALQRELEAVRERYKKQLAEKEGEVERMRKEVQSLKSKEAAEVRAENKASKDVEQEMQNKVRSLEFQLMEKEKERASLQISLDRIQKEKHQMATEIARKNVPASKVAADRGRRPRSGSRGTRTLLGKNVASQESVRATESDTALPPYPTARELSVDRQYQPGSFTGVHIEDVLRENEALKVKVDRLQLEVEHSRINHQKMLAEVESRDRRTAEQMEEQISALKLSHQVEVQKILSEHAMSYSTTRLAELQGQVDTQEVMIRHLREQLGDSHVDREQLAACKVRTTTLESQVSSLLDELKEAQKSHTPEMRHYMVIQDQIKKLEERHRLREQELKQIIHQSQALAAADMEREVEKWKKIVEDKNREVEKFRAELDKILQVLKELHRQGVVLPVGSSSSSRGSDR